MTSRGNLFDSVVEPEETEASDKESSSTSSSDADQEIKSEEEAEEYGISIVTEPEYAEVYINGDYYGYTPLVISSLEKGNYQIELSINGYHKEELWVSYDEEEYIEIDLTLEPITGFIDISSEIPDAVIILDDTEYSPGIHEIPIGDYEVRARKFGYKDYISSVVIRENETTPLSIKLEEAEFEVSGFTLSQSRFNPENPGKLGNLYIEFEVTKYGHGRIEIEDSSGAVVFEEDIGPFTSWNQEVKWDGSGSDEETVSDGEYIIFLECWEDDSQPALKRETSVAVDRTAVIRYKPMLTGVSGMLFTGTPDVLPKGSYQAGAFIMGHFEKAESGYSAFFPAQLSFRWSPLHNFEVSGQGTSFMETDGTSPFSLGAGIKFRFLNAGEKFKTAGALAFKGTFLSRESTDTLTNFQGFALGLPWEFRLGPVSLILMPDVMISNRNVAYGIEDRTIPERSFYAWGYARTGIALDFGTVWGGISGAMRTYPFCMGVYPQLPISLGGELHLVVPDTQLTFSVLTAGEFVSLTNFYGLFGIGLGFIN